MKPKLLLLAIALLLPLAAFATDTQYTETQSKSGTTGKAAEFKALVDPSTGKLIPYVTGIGPITLEPSNLATSAKQDTGNTSLGTIATNTATAVGTGTLVSSTAYEASHVTPAWVIGSPDGPAGKLYYSTDDAPTPDLCTTWLNASDDSPASITVTSVTAGELAAGLRIGDVTYPLNGSANGRGKYSDVLGVAPDVTWDGTQWTDGTTNGTGNTAFPWDAGLGVRDDVASEANWALAA